MLDRFRRLIPTDSDKGQNREIAEILAAKVTPADADNRSYDAAIKSAVTNLLLQGAIPWLVSCMQKYTEDEFHSKMAAGFDFISDWKSHHRFRYGAFITGAKAIRGRFYWNSGAIVDGVVLILEREGWKLMEPERLRLLTTVERVRAEIYG